MEFLADVKFFVKKPSQKGKEQKKSKSDSFCEQKKNKKEMEFEQKLAKEKEGMLEKEKQLKINRLVQEVCNAKLHWKKIGWIFSGFILAGHLFNDVKDNEFLKAVSLQSSVAMFACF